MWTLAIDTAGTSGGVALGDGKSVFFAELAGRSYSAQLVSAADGLFRQAGILLPQISFLAVVTGPGSFTGLRVGLSIAKAWAETTNVKLIAISRLALCAATITEHDDVRVALDAGRGEFFVGHYRGRGNVMVREALVSKEDLLAASESAVPIVVYEEVAAQALSSLSPSRRPIPTAVDALRFAERAAAECRFSDALTLDANYLRRSDAELFAKPKFAPAGLMKQEIAIRSATVGDLRDIIQIEQHAATAAHWTGATYSRLLSAEARSNPKRIMLVAERADQIVGFAAAAALFTNAKPPECELENIAISTHAVRTGVGRALLLRVSEWALGLGAKTLNAEVRESNVPALALYSAAGFEEIARRKSYYADPAEDAVLLKLHL